MYKALQCQSGEHVGANKEGNMYKMDIQVHGGLKIYIPFIV